MNTWQTMSEASLVAAFGVGAEPTLPWLGGGTLVLTAIAFLLCRWRRRLILVAFPLSALPVLMMASTLHDAYFVPNIRAELGTWYLVAAHLALLCPFAGMLIGIILRTRSVGARSAGLAPAQDDDQTLKQRE